jgi:hypothetical protein
VRVSGRERDEMRVVNLIVFISKRMILFLMCLNMLSLAFVVKLSAVIPGTFTSFMDNCPLNIAAAVRNTPELGSQAAIMFLALNTCCVSSPTVNDW